jgi:hypothetical protein
MIRACLLVPVLAACTHDVRLGTVIDATVDVAADSAGNPFVAGSYALSFLDPPTTQCQGALSGMESQFAGVTLAQESLINGTVALATPSGTTLAISGSTISSGWGVASLSLAPNFSGLPATVWAADVTTDLGAGPDSTVHDFMLLAFDSTTTSTPGGVEGEVGVGFDTSGMTGTCTVTFGALLQKQ